MDSLNSYLASIDWKVYLLLLPVGILIGALLKEAGKDLYNRISNKLFPKHEHEKQIQIVVQSKHEMSKKVSAEDIKIAPSAVERISKLSYSDIMNSIEAAPPLQRDRVRDNFVGIRVQWDAFFHGGSEKATKQYRVTLKSKEAALGLIMCEVSAKDYPELRILNAGIPIRIIGNILKVYDLHIELTDVRLEIVS